VLTVTDTGVILATGSTKGGSVTLSSGTTGTTTVAGRIDVSATATAAADPVPPPAVGGAVAVLGNTINVSSTARIDATGDHGGGTVHIGGGWHGAPVADGTIASKVTIASDAVIDASAKLAGKGGTIVAWSDVHNPLSATTVAGTLLAKGGATQGDGGNVETSGHQLNVNGIRVNTAANHGAAGNWLLDPYDITIVASGGTGGLSGGSFTSGTGFSSIDAAAIQAGLTTTNVTIQTGGTTGDGNGNGNIAVNSALSWSSANTLRLIAHGGVSGSQSITIGTGGGLIINQAGTSTYSGVITGAGSLTKLGSGTLTLTGNNTFSGGTTISAGSLAISTDSNLGAAPSTATATSLVLNGGALQASLGLTGTTNTIALDTNRGISIGTGGGTIITDSGVALTSSAAVTATGNLTKNGAGTLLLSGDYSFSPVSGSPSFSTTTINAGSLVLRNDAPSIGGSINGFFRFTGAGGLTIEPLSASFMVSGSNTSGPLRLSDLAPAIDGLGSFTLGKASNTRNILVDAKVTAASQAYYGGDVTVSIPASTVNSVVTPSTLDITAGNKLTLYAQGSLSINNAINVSGANSGVALAYNMAGGSATGDYSFGLTAGGFAGRISYDNSNGVTGQTLTIQNGANGGAAKSYTLLYSLADFDTKIAMDTSATAVALARSVNNDGVFRTNLVSNGTWFRGAFTGLGNQISNLALTGTDHVGIFKYGGNESSVRDLRIVDANVSGGYMTGIVFGQTECCNASRLSNLYVSGSVIANREFTGGLIGYDDGGVSSNIFANNLSVSGTSYVGGFSGRSSSRWRPPRRWRWPPRNWARGCTQRNRATLRATPRAARMRGRPAPPRSRAPWRRSPRAGLAAARPARCAP
jgi:autotransporter-associated beta strand protein